MKTFYALSVTGKKSVDGENLILERRAASHPQNETRTFKAPTFLIVSLTIAVWNNVRLVGAMHHGEIKSSLRERVALVRRENAKMQQNWWKQVSLVNEREK